MKPIIISYDCVDHDPIELWLPDNPYNVDFWMNFTIGIDHRGGDNFQVRVISPRNLTGPKAGKFAIVLEEYSWTNLLEKVTCILAKCQGSDWDDVSGKLSMYFYWEFENYKS